MAMQKMSLADFLMQSQGLSPVAKAPELTPPMVGAPLPQGAFPPTTQPQGFMQRLQRDPSLSLALMNAGIAMMQPTPRGQTHLGHAAQGLGVGAQTYLSDVDRRQKKDLLDKQANLEERRTSVLERGDQRQEKAAEREDEAYTYGISQRERTEALADLQLEGAKIGLDVAKLERDLKRQFGAKEAQARLDQLLARSNYYKTGGARGARSVAADVQQVGARAQTFWAEKGGDPSQPPDTESWQKAWKAFDAMKTASVAPAMARVDATREAALMKVLMNPLAEEGDVAAARAELIRLQQRGEGAQAPVEGGGRKVFPDGTPVNYDTVRARYVRSHPTAKDDEIEKEVQAYLKTVDPSWTPEQR